MDGPRATAKGVAPAEKHPAWGPRWGDWGARLCHCPLATLSLSVPTWNTGSRAETAEAGGPWLGTGPGLLGSRTVRPGDSGLLTARPDPSPSLVLVCLSEKWGDSGLAGRGASFPCGDSRPSGTLPAFVLIWTVEARFRLEVSHHPLRVSRHPPTCTFPVPPFPCPVPFHFLSPDLHSPNSWVTSEPPGHAGKGHG